MRPIGDPERNWQAAPAHGLARPRALRKPSDASDLLDKSHHAQEQKPSAPQPEGEPSLPQPGTPEPVSFRHEGIRLTAGFTAQLLGQILPDPERRASAAKAYDRLARRRRSDFDELL